MSVIFETSKGDIVIDLFYEDCPIACKNFLKLCKIKYYNNCLIHNVQPNFIIQTGDPHGNGGNSIFGVLYGEQARFFEHEIRPHLRHKNRGMVGMVAAGGKLNASQFYITTGEDLDSLDEKYTIFGQVAEGMEVVDAINDAYCDDAGRPYQNIRIRHTIILEDPFDDPPELAEHIPPQSPEPVFAAEPGRLEEDWVAPEETRDADEVEASNRANEAANRAVVLEMIGDLPDADVKPPSNMLFVCKLNPVTTDEDLEIVFSRFGHVTSCDVIKDWKTGDSLCYAFIGFDSDLACEEAYFKMNNAVIDDRRIKVDFSQSVYHLWKQFRKFGGRGNKDSQQAADQHIRQERPRERFTLKEGVGGVYSNQHAGRGGYGLVMGDDDDHHHHQQQRRRDDRHSRGERSKHEEEHRRRRRSRSRSRSPKRHSSKKDKHRRRSPSPGRRRSRSPSRKSHKHYR